MGLDLLSEMSCLHMTDIFLEPADNVYRHNTLSDCQTYGIVDNDFVSYSVETCRDDFCDGNSLRTLCLLTVSVTRR